jgi:DNA-binding NarL/FixJ family response regulator
MALGRRDRAEDVAAVVDGLIAVTPGVPSIEAAGWRCRGLLDDDADVLLRAVAALRDGPRPLDLALVAEEAAEGLARAGRSDEAKAMFEETVEVFERLDADWAVARITSRMRELGIRRGSRQRHRVHRTGWDALTTKELSVVELVALGLSNPEVAERLFLSRRTVKAHVSSALRKLSMTSRVELAREAGNRRGPPNVQPSGRPGLLGTSDTTESARIRRS